MLPESLNDAYIEAVKLLGGSKVVGVALWPTRGVEAAQRHLLACLSDSRNEKLSPDDALHIEKLARDRGIHVVMQFRADYLSYAPPLPVDPKDEIADLERANNELLQQVLRNQTKNQPRSKHQRAGCTAECCVSIRILQGDCRDVLKTLPAASVHCCVTSPPYFGLRDYGRDGQIGLESTPAEYVEQMVAVFREVRRVLRDDGTLWLNLGDSYGRGKRTENPSDGKRGTGFHAAVTKDAGYGAPVLLQEQPSKQLLGIPWRVAFALQADGWYLRQDIIWSKPNPMPESVRDRCTKAHEYVFLLSKSDRYRFDAEAIAEAATGQAPGNRSHKGTTALEGGDEKHRTKAGLVAYAERQRSKRDSFKREDSKRAAVMPGQSVGTHRLGRAESDYPLDTRNKRSVWTIATKPFAEAHFATMAPELAETCIKAGCPIGGTVLDPFGGAGTTGLVADQLQRDALLIELNPVYGDIARRRITADCSLFSEIAA